MYLLQVQRFDANSEELWNGAWFKEANYETMLITLVPEF